jgi:hypothetical protein
MRGNYKIKLLNFNSFWPSIKSNKII